MSRNKSPFILISFLISYQFLKRGVSIYKLVLGHKLLQHLVLLGWDRADLIAYELLHHLVMRSCYATETCVVFEPMSGSV